MRPDINLISVPSLKGLIQGYKEKGQRKEKFSVAGHRGGGEVTFCKGSACETIHADRGNESLAWATRIKSFVHVGQVSVMG